MLVEPLDSEAVLAVGVAELHWNQGLVLSLHHGHGFGDISHCHRGGVCHGKHCSGGRRWRCGACIARGRATNMERPRITCFPNSTIAFREHQNRHYDPS